MSKVVHRPLSILVSVPAGMLAGAIFKRIWRIAAREDQAPSATDARRGWTEILVAAALEGAIFAVVKAALDRGTAHAAHQLTGTWPGDEGSPQEREGTK
jgi:predicted metal-dependent enzyme (double-stranded beta helix superfamily)